MNELKVLFLEDSAEDAELTGIILKKAGIDFDFRLVDTQDEYCQALADYQPDLVLADHSLYHFNSLEALKIFKATGLTVPFILVTGTVSEEFAVKILKEGADDYLLKDNLVRLPSAIQNSLEKHRLSREKQEYLDNIISNEALMKEAQQLAHFGSWEADINTGEVKWSDEIFRIYGYEPGEVKPGHDIILHHIHPEDRPIYQQAIYSRMEQTDAFGSEMRIIDKKGITKFIYFKIVARRGEKGLLTRLLGFMQDMTEKKLMEKELAEQVLRQQKLITEVTIQAQEKERSELGRELHDNINQVLATVKMCLTMSVTKPEKRDDLVSRAITNTNLAIEEIRKLSKSLVAPTLGDIGLIHALQMLVEEANLSEKPTVQLVADMADKRLADMNMELMVYRIVQEQLNNIRKYAEAGKAAITLKTEGNHLFFSIADDGVGFDPAQKANGIGLKNIRSRVDFYSGTMEIISSPGNGCELKISFPL